MDHIVLLALTGDRCQPIVLSGSGIVLWRMVADGFQSIGSIASQIETEYGTDRESAISSIYGLFSDLERFELVELTPGGGGD